MAQDDPKAVQSPRVGEINWIDLTVPDAPRVREFYQQVTGWTASGVEMGGYEDWCMNTPSTNRSVAGVCHARASNLGLPAVWLIYITVADLEASMKRCVELGGVVTSGPRNMAGQGRYAVIRDPAGAHAALWEQASGVDGP